MKTGLVTDILDFMTFEEMLDTCVELNIETLELGTGNWSQAPHLDLDLLLQNQDHRKNFLQAIHSRGLSISALNCSGNQLDPKERGQEHKETIEKTFQLANLLEVPTVVMMSGCPGGAPEDSTPNWYTHPILPHHFESLDWQWNEVAFPYWHEAAKKAKEYGVEKIALENLGFNLVYNPETLFKLRNEVGDMIGMNLDPSHMFWMGGDPIASIRELGSAIYHVHAKDVRIERGINDAQGLIDIKPMESFATRSWNYVALGYGHNDTWWKEFFTVLTMEGYKGPVVLEMEDLSMSALTGVTKSMETLHSTLPRINNKKTLNYVQK